MQRFPAPLCRPGLSHDGISAAHRLGRAAISIVEDASLIPRSMRRNDDPCRLVVARRCYSLFRTWGTIDSRWNRPFAWMSTADLDPAQRKSTIRKCRNRFPPRSKSEAFVGAYVQQN